MISESEYLKNISRGHFFDDIKDKLWAKKININPDFEEDIYKFLDSFYRSRGDINHGSNMQMLLEINVRIPEFKSINFIYNERYENYISIVTKMCIDDDIESIEALFKPKLSNRIMPDNLFYAADNHSTHVLKFLWDRVEKKTREIVT